MIPPSSRGCKRYKLAQASEEAQTAFAKRLSSCPMSLGIETSYSRLSLVLVIVIIVHICLSLGLLLLAFPFHQGLLCIVLLKGPLWHSVQVKQRLVGLLDKEVLSCTAPKFVNTAFYFS